MKMYFVTEWNKDGNIVQIRRISDVTELLELVIAYQQDGTKFDVCEAECIVDES